MSKMQLNIRRGLCHKPVLKNGGLSTFLGDKILKTQAGDAFKEDFSAVCQLMHHHQGSSGMVWDRQRGGDTPGGCRDAPGWAEVWGWRDPAQENTLGSKRVSPGSKGAGMQQTGKLTSSSLPTNAEVIHVQTNNSSINNAAAPTS